MPGLGTSFGRGGATTFVQDLRTSDCILIEGSNFAECHPVAFRFVMEAKLRGATIIHVDPRYTRTSAVADVYAPIRSGSDIVFLGAVINWLLTNERYFREYVVAYTNAPNIVREDFKDTEDLDGLFSGFRGGAEPGFNDEGATVMSHMGAAGSRPAEGAERSYDVETWGFEYDEVPGADGAPVRVVRRDETLTHPRCVLNMLQRHFARYTAEMVENACGMPRETFERICNLLADNSGRERTTAFAYAVGWTQHTVGVQYIRTASILQLLLGNIGRPGGGIMALRGHANIQGATDVATLYDLLPGYIPMPSAQRDEQTLADYLRLNTKPSGWWSNFPTYVISQLKAFFGDAAQPENDFCFEYLPQINGDHSTLPTQIAMKDGEVEGYFVIGMNPAASGFNAEQARTAMEHLKWMVVVDSFETETSAYWKREGVDPTTIDTEVFFIPADTVLEKEGTMVNTNRMLQWHDKAVDAPGECVSDLWFFHQLGKRLKELYADSTDPKDRPILDLTWDYEHEDEHERRRGEPSALKVLQEINGYDVATGAQIASFVDLRADGSTAAGAWIYTGVCPDATTNRARNRNGDDGTSLDWGFAWPANRRMLYNRASADPQGRPWSERKKYVWWDEEQRRWTGVDVPDFPVSKNPATPARPGASGLDAHSGSDPFIMQLDGRGALFVSGALKDGPFPTHYEPVASVLKNPLYEQQSSPTLREWHRDDNPYNEPIDPRYPHVLTTYRLTEQNGVMSRYTPWLSELQPALFAEISPELAVEAGIHNGDWCTISTAAGEVEARALVSGRMRPLMVGEGAARRRVYQIGMPYNFGELGHASSDSVGFLIPLAMDPNVSIHEAKTTTCAIRPGRRAPRTHSAPADRDVPWDQRSDYGQPTVHGIDIGEVKA